MARKISPASQTIYVQYIGLSHVHLHKLYHTEITFSPYVRLAFDFRATAGPADVLHLNLITLRLILSNTRSILHT